MLTVEREIQSRREVGSHRRSRACWIGFHRASWRDVGGRSTLHLQQSGASLHRSSDWRRCWASHRLNLNGDGPLAIGKEGQFRTGVRSRPAGSGSRRLGMGLP